MRGIRVTVWFRVTVLASGLALLATAAGRERPRDREIDRGTVRAGGLERTFSYYLPAMVDRAAPLVFVLHGSGGDGARIRSFIGGELEWLADELGFVIVYPDGWEGHWNDCRGRAPFSANVVRVDDLAFFRAVADRMRRELGIRDTRIAALGYSNGGHMAYRLALESPDEVSAVVAFGANLPVDGELDCPVSGQPTSVMLVNGTADAINPYDGGEVVAPGDVALGRVRSARATAAYFASLMRSDAAGSASVSTRVLVPQDSAGLSVVRQVWRAPGHEVRLYTVQNGGHTIPNPGLEFPAFLGRTERRFNAVESAVRFLLGRDAE